MIKSLKIFLVLSLLGHAPSYGSNSRIYGSWFSSTRYGMTFIKLYRNYSFDWYYHSCTFKDGYFNGSYRVAADSIILKSETEEFLFFHVNGVLTTQPNENLDQLDSRFGMVRTMRRSKFGAYQKWKHEQNKRRRQRNRNIR